jgi:succinate-acetate transporter protein
MSLLPSCHHRGRRANLDVVCRIPQTNPAPFFGANESIFGLAVFFGGTIQIIAAILEFTLGHTFGMTTHGSYGAFWLSYSMFLIPSLGIKDAYVGDDNAYSFSVGIYMIMWCFLTLIFLLASLKSNIANILLFIFLFLSLLFGSLANFVFTINTVVSIGLFKSSGALSVICASFAFYIAASGLISLETTYFKLPLGDLEEHGAVRE